MHLNAPGDYISRLIEDSTNEGLGDIIGQIPPEIGRCRIQERRSHRGAAFFNWEMEYQNPIYVERRKKRETFNDSVQLIFFLNNGLEWEFGETGEPVSVEEGEVCIYRDQDQPSAARYPGGQEFLFKNIQLPMTLFAQAFEGHFDRGEKLQTEKMLQTVTKTLITPYMFRLLQEIEQADCYRGGMASFYLEGKILELTGACLGAGLEMGDNAFTRKKLSVSRTDRDVILEIRKKIDRGCTEFCPCEALAREAGISMSKLKRCFREMTGMPLHSYVIDRRLEHAAYLLAENRVNVSQAAIQSGYSNMSHFSAAFKKKFGVAPRDFCG